MPDPATPSLTGLDWQALVRDPAMGAMKQQWDADQHIFDPSLPAQNVYVVEQGQVRLYQPGSGKTHRLIDIFGPGDWLGVEALADEPRFQTLALAAEPTTVWAVSVKRLLDRLTEDSQAIRTLIRMLAGKLLQARAEAGRYVFDDCNARLINTLLRFSNSAASTRQQDGVVLRITHQELAQAVGVARETVSLALTQLRQRNLLRTGRNQLFFNPDVLRKFRSRPDVEPQRDPGAAI